MFFSKFALFRFYAVKDHKRGTKRIIAQALMVPLMRQQIAQVLNCTKNGRSLQYMIIAFEIYIFC